MAGVAAEHELYRACRIIFGSELAVSREFLEYVQLSGVKSAFRKKAMEIHPDRLNGGGELARRRSARMFHSVQQAYEKLTHYVNARERGFRFHGMRPPASFARTGQRNPGHGKTKWSGSSVFKKRFSQSSKGWHSRNTVRPFHQAGSRTSKAAPAKRRYQGKIPERHLLFGHYLYYAGLASWHSIVKALIWQKSQRPRLGEIARQRGWLSTDDVLAVLKGCPSSSLLFGEEAVRQGLLSKKQLQMLMLHQKRLHKKFGEFFIKNKHFTPRQLTLHLASFHSHNARIARLSPARKK